MSSHKTLSQRILNVCTNHKQGTFYKVPFLEKISAIYLVATIKKLIRKFCVNKKVSFFSIFCHYGGDLPSKKDGKI